MIQAYDDEDNVPMCADLPPPYPIRTWEEMLREWEGNIRCLIGLPLVDAAERSENDV